MTPDMRTHWLPSLPTLRDNGHVLHEWLRPRYVRAGHSGDDVTCRACDSASLVPGDSERAS